MTAVERLNEKHAEKLAYYMSKADQVEKEHDRQRVLIQITQNLAGRIKNSHAFKLPTIYLPRDDLAVPIPNAIEEVCEDVDKAIRLTVQKNLTTMKDDCVKIVKAIDARGEEDARRKKDNAARTIKGWAFMFAGWLVLSLLAYVATLETFALRPVAVAMRVHALPRLSEDEFPVARAVMTGLLPTEVAEGEVAAKRWMGVENGGLYAMAWLSVAYVTLQVMKRKAWRGREARLTKREWKKLEGYRAYAIEVSAVREELYKEYFKQLHEGDGY
jgi:hypothetical protein